MTFSSHHSCKKRKDSLETRAEPAVLCIYVENQAVLEPIILLYRPSKCKQTYGPTFLPSCETNISNFLSYRSRCAHTRIKLSYNNLRFVAEILNTFSYTENLTGYKSRIIKLLCRILLGFAKIHLNTREPGS